MGAGNEAGMAQTLAQGRVNLMASLGAASMESYQKSYPIVARLHMLQELEQAASLKNYNLFNPDNEIQCMCRCPREFAINFVI